MKNNCGYEEILIDEFGTKLRISCAILGNTDDFKCFLIKDPQTFLKLSKYNRPFLYQDLLNGEILDQFYFQPLSHLKNLDLYGASKTVSGKVLDNFEVIKYLHNANKNNEKR